VEVRRLDKRGERGATGGIGFYTQRGAEVNFTEAQAGGDETIERDGRRFKFHAEVATIVVHADAAEQALGLDGAIARPPGVEKIHGLRRRLERAARFRLKAEV